MKLSILIPTIDTRQELFDELVHHINIIGDGYDYELITICDDKTLSCGQKKQRLLEMASGEYVVFVDDDDTLADDFFHQVYAAMESNPDSIGYLIQCPNNTISCCSTRYTEWNDNVDGYDHVRYALDKTPVRRSIAMIARFPSMRYYDDYAFSMNLRDTGLLVSEVFINSPMYIYRYVNDEPYETKYGFKR